MEETFRAEAQRRRADRLWTLDRWGMYEVQVGRVLRNAPQGRADKTVEYPISNKEFPIIKFGREEQE